MNNGLRRLEKILRLLAKRCKQIKYTKELLLTFLFNGLLFGMPARLEGSTSAADTRKQISGSIEDMKNLLREARKENSKLIRDTNLELIQLMEQGDQVVKSPWASWHVGSGFYYSDWKNIYKGYGNKKEDIIFYRDVPGDPLSRYVKSGRNGIYGMTELNLDYTAEPNAEIAVNASVTPKSIDKAAPTFTVTGPAGGLPAFTTRTVSAPASPDTITVVPPVLANPANINFTGKGFSQGAEVSMPQSNIIMQNYDTYEVVDSSGNVTSTPVIITTGASGTTWTGSRIKAVTNVPSVATPGITQGGKPWAPHEPWSPAGAGTFYLDPGSTTHSLNAFINELRDHDMNIKGNYEMTNTGGGTDGHTRIFISHNPAGVGNASNASTPAGTASGPYDGINTPNTPRTLTFDANLKLHGTSSPSNNNVDVLAGIEHQFWYTNIPTEYNATGSYSIFRNIGTIDLASGNNLIGIMIDVERRDAGSTTENTHRTVNDGNIVISGASNSIGIDYGEYSDRTLDSDLTLGNITVGGSGNYGFRMRDVFKVPNPTNHYNKIYFNNTKVKSGGSTKAITVEGTNNVGIAIQKSLSDTATATANAAINFGGGSGDDNPVANLSDLNVTVNGNTGVGFWRMPNYSDNNTNNMVLTPAVMGTFKFGANAVSSTLIRSDNYGIEIKDTITTGTGTSRNSFVQAVGDGFIINTSTLTGTNANAEILGQTSFTGMISSKTGSAVPYVENQGAINIDGTGSRNIGMAAIGGAKLVNSGNINISGTSTPTTGHSRIAVYNDLGSTAEINDVAGSPSAPASPVMTAEGYKSAVLYNKGTMTIGSSGGTTDIKVNGKNGATGIYAEGTASTVTSSAQGRFKVNIDESANASDYKGVGAYSNNSAAVNIAGAEVDVKKGGAGLAAVNSGKIDITGGKLAYDGEGYALYTDNNGQINAANATVKLDGKAVGFIVDGSGGSYSSDVNLTGATVNIDSDDVILMSIANPLTMNLSNYDTVLRAASGLTTPIGGTATNYKLAVVEDLNNGKSFNLDISLDKGEAVSNTSSQSYKYVRNFLIQRSILDVNSDIKAVLSTADMTALKESAVYGLAISSSKGATDNSLTGINVNAGTKVTADRTDSGSGAIGLYTNFGTVNVAAGGSIDIEADASNTVNSQAVGIYAVNGSAVNNRGDVTVGGEDSIGLLGLSYRETSGGSVIGNEFNSANEGRVSIDNYGKIIMDGKAAKGIYVKNNSSSALVPGISGVTLVTDNRATNRTGGLISLTGDKAVGMSGNKAHMLNDAGGTIELKGTSAQIGMYGNNGSIIENKGIIKVGDTSGAVPNVGMYTDDLGTVLRTEGEIEAGKNSFGVYGKSVTMDGGKITVADNGAGIFSTGPLVNLNGGTIKVGDNEAVGVFTADDRVSPVPVTINGNVDMEIGKNSFGYVLASTTAGSGLTTGSSNSAMLDTDSVFIYSANPLGSIVNRSAVTLMGDKNYGIYATGNVDNYGNMEMSTGIGNVGMYSTGGKSVNHVTINVGGTDSSLELYGIGMATGYYNKSTGAVSNQGTVINTGIINVNKEQGIGMYAVGSGSRAENGTATGGVNSGIINLIANNTTGMYIDHGATGINYGTIRTVAAGNGMKGVVVTNGGILKNYGRIEVIGDKNIGVYKDGEASTSVSERAEDTDPLTGNRGVNSSTVPVVKGSSTDTKSAGGVTVKVPPAASIPTVTVNGVNVPITFVDTTVSKPTAPNVKIVSSGATQIMDLNGDILSSHVSKGTVSPIGMYVDTSGINYTNPIQGLEHLKGLSEINLIFGPEAMRYTNDKAIQVGKNILEPYNDALKGVVATGTKLVVNSANLTWIAQPIQSKSTGLIETVYLVKIPYASFAKDPDTYKFMEGIEELYPGAKGREKDIFNKINDIGKAEAHILAQAMDQMKGHQYANIQQRLYTTGAILDREFEHLRDEWDNVSKKSNKIKTFGTKGEYSTDTKGIIDYRYNGYGVAYVHENETVRRGESGGWYAGAAYNSFKFKDIGKSKEDTFMVKGGVFTSVPFDYNNSLNWTVSGEIYAARTDMQRKFWIVDEVFGAKASYNSYGAALKNEIGKELRLGERFSLKPYGSLKLEYGRYSDIKEKTGEIKLNVKGNDYYSIKPEAGIEFRYRQPLALKTTFVAGLGLSYSNELGQLSNVRNRVAVQGTKAEYYTLASEKEDRKGNFKADLNIGIENKRFGVTFNAGYDTKGENIRGSIGFRTIF